MHSIEKKIKNNLDYFNTHYPDKNHTTRFEEKLNLRLNPKSKNKNYSLLLKVAAIFLLLISISLLLINNNSDKLREEMYITQIEYSPDFSLVQDYYDEISIEQLNKIEELAVSTDEATRLKLNAQKQMKKLDANLAKIEKEYIKNPQCKKLKAAIINNKRMKATVADNIVEQLNKVQHEYYVGTMYTNF